MKFKIRNFDKYYLGFNADKHIANYLGMTKNEYQNILKLNGAINISSISMVKDEYFFKNEEDAKKAIEILEFYLIMVVLTEK